MPSDPLLPIGKIARRIGCNVSAIRFYADEGLVPFTRASSGHRYFARSSIILFFNMYFRAYETRLSAQALS